MRARRLGADDGRERLAGAGADMTAGRAMDRGRCHTRVGRSSGRNRVDRRSRADAAQQRSAVQAQWIRTRRGQEATRSRALVKAGATIVHRDAQHSLARALTQIAPSHQSVRSSSAI